ncbi:MAG: hemerythrin domain-containing protein [Spirochaetota bacterium]|nr:hemerythrin domain-containing protein [Spirochaetota bacterium]
MSELVNELKKEHDILVTVLNEVKEIGISSQEGKDKLSAAKNGLLAHLKKEDEQLYPKLRVAATSNEQLQRTLDHFLREMEEISSFAIEFFGKYESGGEGVEFIRDFGKLIGGLRGRIRREENILYPEYDKLFP